MRTRWWLERQVEPGKVELGSQLEASLANLAPSQLPQHPASNYSQT